MALTAGRWRAAIAGAAWAAATAIALVVTLPGVQPDDDFDGLNNALQIPFALPWFLLPLPGLIGTSHETQAWIGAGYGFLNAASLYLMLVRRWRPGAGAAAVREK